MRCEQTGVSGVHVNDVARFGAASAKIVEKRHSFWTSAQDAARICPSSVSGMFERHFDALTTRGEVVASWVKEETALC